jgi:hypothetical protein
MSHLARCSYATLLPDLGRNKFRYRGRWHKIFGYVGAAEVDAVARGVRAFDDMDGVEFEGLVRILSGGGLAERTLRALCRSVANDPKGT